MGQVTFLVEFDVHFQSQCSVRAFILQSQALVANELNFWRCLESVIEFFFFLIFRMVYPEYEYMQNVSGVLLSNFHY